MRVISVLLGIAVVAFLLWPNMIPIGFSGVWWASHQARAPAEPSAPAPEVISAKPPMLPAKHALTNPAEPATAEEKTGMITPKAETKLYRRVIVRDGGTLEAGGAVIRLAGIAAHGAEDTCEDARGKIWPCGAAAKAALAKLVRARAVTCTLLKSGERNIFSGKHTIVARCSLGGTDLSAWMVRQGWAEPQEPNEAPLIEAAQAAKKERLGLWRDGN